MSCRRKIITSKLDHKQVLHRPLDYSFKAASYFEDFLSEKPRTEGLKQFDLEDELSEESSGTVDIVQSDTNSLKVNNNMLTKWDGFMDTISKLFVDAPTTIAWIDFSFNDLTIIDYSLLQLPNLTVLYFHGNNIDAITQVDKLSALTKLRSLALHGNPIEIIEGYRQYVLSRIHHLKTFDFGAITKADRATADTWSTMIAHKPKKRISRDAT